jgi:hypothetical protein
MGKCRRISYAAYGCDFRHVPADLHSVPGSQGGLGLMFKRLDSFTKLQYIIAWKNKPGHKTYPHKATINAAGSDWERSAERKFGGFSARQTVHP